jgi:hypothetical protein
MKNIPSKDIKIEIKLNGNNQASRPINTNQNPQNKERKDQTAKFTDSNPF